MATYIDGFLAASLLILALQLIFSLMGLPFDRRYLPLRTCSLKRNNNAAGGSIFILLLHFVQNGVRFTLLHLGCLLSAAIRAVNPGNYKPVPYKWEVSIARP